MLITVDSGAERSCRHQSVRSNCVLVKHEQLLVLIPVQASVMALCQSQEAEESVYSEGKVSACLYVHASDLQT